MRDLLQCKACKQTWPTPQYTDKGKQVSMNRCPKCGGEPKRVGSCDKP